MADPPPRASAHGQGRTVQIDVPALARVEGEGALRLRIRDGEIEELALRIYEPPRLFEKALEGRSYEEVPDMVARICGICPVAYQISAVNALENAFGVEVDPWVQTMRRVLYCGEWIESHCLHIHLLAAPDYFGYESAIAMSREHPEVVRRGLRLQGLGNDLIRLLGGRSVHPVSVRVGGFHRAPETADVVAMRRRLQDALSDSEALVRWTAAIAVPSDRQNFVSVALRHDQEYPIHQGYIGADDGLAVGPEDFEHQFSEHQLVHSTALASQYRGAGYLVGPLARLNLNRERLPAPLQGLIGEVGPSFPSSNMFNSMFVRAIEVHFAIAEANRLLEHYAPPRAPAVGVTPCASIGYGCSEAPRGLLWHRYRTDAQGRILAARIVPPTSQNQARIEEDLRLSLLSFGLEHSDEDLRLHCEKVIRNYDPCISCATHFLRLTTERL